MTLPDTRDGTPTLGKPTPVTGQYRKRPHMITATRWWANGDHPGDGVGQDCAEPTSGDDDHRCEGAVVRFYRHPDVLPDRECAHCGHTMREHGWVETLEGGHIVCPGDWIVTGTAGERYPVKPHIFDQTYEPVVV